MKHVSDTPFAREADLVRHLLRLLPQYLEQEAKHHLLAVEVGVGRAIADVAAVMWDDPLEPPPPLSARDSVVLSTLRRWGPTRVDILEARCGLSRGALRSGELDHLQTMNLLDRGPGGRVALATDWAQRIRIVAIEAKLHDWKTAIRQAQRYLQYADEAFVALPRPMVQRLNGSLGDFQKACVGLISVGPELMIEVPASRRSTHDWRREFAGSRLLAERIHD